MQDNKFKISTATWNKEFELPDRSYSVSDIHGYFENIVKKHKTFIDISPVRTSVNEIENRITFKIKTGHYLEHLTPEVIKSLGST